MFSESAQKIFSEEVEEILPRIEKIHFAARSGGPNEMLYVQSRCDQIKKLLKEIQEKV